MGRKSSIKPRKILLLGMSPMPFENDRKVYGTGIRTWQFLEPLLKKGHRICVCNYAIPSAYDEDFNSSHMDDFRIDDDIYGDLAFDYHILVKEDFENIEVLKSIHEDFRPECLVGCSFYPSYYGSRLLASLNNPAVKADTGAVNTESAAVPFWADLFGHVMAEAQARAYMDNSDDCLFHYWNSEYRILTSADIFSCVSRRQEYALIGELGAVGRLNKYTSGYRFTTAIPCGMPLNRFSHKKNVIRGLRGVAEDDFVVLWTGGYNTWTDVDTLFKGLLLAMKKNPKIKFVSTGGEIPEQDLKTYPRFISMIERSDYRKNFIMMGWIAGEDVPSYYFEADAGINIDKDIYEVELGSKNRILDWMRAGLAVVSSDVCELTEIIRKEKIGYTFRPGDEKDLASTLLYLAANRKEVELTAKRGTDYGKKHFSFESTTKKLQQWVSNPLFAPDHGKQKKVFFEKEKALKNLESIVSRQKQMISERDERIRELEGMVKKGFAYRFYSYLKIAKRKIIKK